MVLQIVSYREVLQHWNLKDRRHWELMKEHMGYGMEERMLEEMASECIGRISEV